MLSRTRNLPTGDIAPILQLIRGSAMAGFAYEKQRIVRMLFPRQKDHAAWLLMNDVGRLWLLLTGWRREYRMLSASGWLVIDLAHPRLKLALEGDGERWHRDIVHEFDRDNLLKAKGWSVKHFRYPVLKHEPRKVKREVRSWYYKALLFRIRPK